MKRHDINTNKFTFSFILLSLFSTLLNLGFWLGLVFGALWLLQYFKIF